MANILLIETSTRPCSVALSRDFAIEFRRSTLDGPAHASVLGQYVEEAMQYARQHDCMPDAVAVSAGPGSYTGLRIGVSEAKGLCFGLGRPLIAVPTLETMVCHVMFSPRYAALADDDNALFCPMIDARRMEVYTALYDRSLAPVRPVGAVVVDGGFLRDVLEERPVILFGDGAAKCRDVIRHPNARFVDDVVPMADDMLALAVRAYRDGRFEDVAYYTPYYLKDFVASTPRDLLSDLGSRAATS